MSAENRKQLEIWRHDVSVIDKESEAMNRRRYEITDKILALTAKIVLDEKMLNSFTWIFYIKDGEYKCPDRFGLSAKGDTYKFVKALSKTGCLENYNDRLVLCGEFGIDEVLLDTNDGDVSLKFSNATTGYDFIKKQGLNVVLPDVAEKIEKKEKELLVLKNLLEMFETNVKLKSSLKE